MSLAVMLNNDPETVSNIESTLDILKKYSSNKIPQDYTSEQIDNLVDWLHDIYKILTDYTMFTES